MFIVMGFFADQVHDYNKGWVVNIDDRIVAVDYYVRSEGLHIIVIAEEWIPYKFAFGAEIGREECGQFEFSMSYTDKQLQYRCNGRFHKISEDHLFQELRNNLIFRMSKHFLPNLSRYI